MNHLNEMVMQMREKNKILADLRKEREALDEQIAQAAIVAGEEIVQEVHNFFTALEEKYDLESATYQVQLNWVSENTAKDSDPEPIYIDSN